MNCICVGLILISSAIAGSVLSRIGGSMKLDLFISDEHMYYIENLSLGSPPQAIANIIIDSGSSDLMIVQSIYNASESSSFVNTNESFLMRYGFDDPFPVYKIYETIENLDFVLPNLTMGYAQTSLIFKAFLVFWV